MYRTLFRRPENLAVKTELVNQYHVFVVSSGYAQGVLSTEHDLKDGNLLYVSTMNPHYLPCLNVASGIIARAGGITCHLSTICRELGIPAAIFPEAEKWLGKNICLDTLEEKVYVHH